MSKKKVLFIIGFVVFLVVLWFVVYNIWLGIEPTGDNFITAEQLEEVDRGIYLDAKVFLNDKEYKLDELNSEILKDNIVVEVEVNKKKVKGYVVYNDTVTEPQVELKDEDDYAKLILPYEDGDNNE